MKLCAIDIDNGTIRDLRNGVELIQMEDKCNHALSPFAYGPRRSAGAAAYPDNEEERRLLRMAEEQKNGPECTQQLQARCHYARVTDFPQFVTTHGNFDNYPWQLRQLPLATSTTTLGNFDVVVKYLFDNDRLIVSSGTRYLKAMTLAT